MLNRIISSIMLLLSAFFILPGEASAQNNNTPSIVFVLESNHAVLTHQAAKQFQLKISLAHVRNVLAFSNRPARKAISVPIDQFWQVISSGEDSFSKLKPNLVLTWAGDHGIPARAYELRDYHVEKQSVTMDLVSLSSAVNAESTATVSGRVSLYIDDLARAAAARAEEEAYLKENPIDYDAVCPP